jgi:hypothetical protein
MKNKLLILYKTAKTNNSFGKIFYLTSFYCNKFDNVDSYFLVCDENLKQDVVLDNKFLYVKRKEDNWESLLVKVIKGMDFFKDSGYTHVYISNISSFNNIPLLYESLSNHSVKYIINRFSNQGPNAVHQFKNLKYEYPTGSGILFNIEFVNELCEFFNKNKYIQNNNLTDEFKNLYPTTDDIFFGYYMIKNDILNCELIKRYDILKAKEIIPNELIYSHYRIKTGHFETDFKFHEKLFKILYTNKY